MFVGICVMTLCMLGLGITDVVAKSEFSQAQGSLLVALVAIFLAASTIGPGVAGWVYTGESGSSRLRAKTTTLGTVGNAIVGLIMTSGKPWWMLDLTRALLNESKLCSPALLAECNIRRQMGGQDGVPLRRSRSRLCRDHLSLRARLYWSNVCEPGRAVLPAYSCSSILQDRVYGRLRKRGGWAGLRCIASRIQRVSVGVACPVQDRPGS